MAIITNSKTGETFAIVGTDPCGHVVIVNVNIGFVGRQAFSVPTQLM